MPKILLVDPSGTDRQYIAGLLGTDRELQWEYASSGQEALEKLSQSRPDLLIANVASPGREGLELLEQIHRCWPTVPVILLTSAQTAQTTAEALRHGAISYLPRERLAERLRQTVAKVLTAAGVQRLQPRLLGCITESSCLFLLENDLSLIGPLIGYLQENLAHIGLLDPAERMRVGLAVEEALSNAIIHGNLELSSQLKDLENHAFEKLLAQRRTSPPYCFRKVSLEVSITPEEARFVITDEGPGFNPQELPNPLDPANLERCSGRGILLMKTFMDQVQYNQKGNQVTLIKRLRSQPPCSQPPSSYCSDG
ncbi:MAG: ATP-binding protein [Thermoguttaceae bacterium]|nr:ATP-binding protein [Thermoguttaceae bacterium]MDW8037804.1 ATP-binding protein [Thermoguttaceae bacterium]